MSITLVNKHTNYKFAIIGCYLPPENSSHAQNADDYFQHLVGMMYEYTDYDFVTICGDFNARLGNKCDYIELIDEVPQRTVIDNTSNDHGISLMQFLLQTRTCVVNGRISPLKDSFTSVSHRGKAVIDYFVVPHEHLDKIIDFEVRNITDVIKTWNLHKLAVKRASDHGILVCKIDLKDRTSTVESESTSDSEGISGPRAGTDSAELGSGEKPPIRYKKGPVPESFLSSNEMVQACEQLIDDLLQLHHNQDELDLIYELYVKVYHDEMSECMKILNMTPVTKKHARHSAKAYWCEELTEYWKETHDAEKLFIKTPKTDHGYLAIKSHFIYLQRRMDKAIKRAKTTLGCH